MITKQRWNHPDYGNDIIAESISDILESNHLLALSACRMSRGVCFPEMATCGFAYSEHGVLYILTPPTSEHGKAFKENPSVAVSIYDSHQNLQAPKKGLQIYGHIQPAHEEKYQSAIPTYKARFPWMEQYVRWHPEWRSHSAHAWLYKITPERIKIFDEERFGEEHFVIIGMKGLHNKG